MKSKILIIGAGGHAKVVAETLALCGNYELIGFVDDKVEAGTEIVPGIKVLGNVASAPKFEFDSFFVAIGNNTLRENLHKKFASSKMPVVLIHPYSCISPSARIAEGSIVLPGAVISAGAVVGTACIIGSNVHIDHETIIGDYCHIRNGSSIGSNCVIKDWYTTETGMNVQPFSTMSHL
jgi:sugar O-acyltransferase (sialic acid O-acetyltransferase NeuD family)